jgi:hypothetical protein
MKVAGMCWTQYQKRESYRGRELQKYLVFLPGVFSRARGSEGAAPGPGS